MDFATFWSQEVFSIAGHAVTLGHLAGVLLGWIFLLTLWMMLRQRWLTWYFTREEI